MHKLYGFVFSLFIFLCAAVCPAQEAPFYTTAPQQETLENGLRCLVLEKPGSGIVSVTISFATGSASEGTFTGSGISHLAEHMAFKSTKRYPRGRILNEIKAIGGSMNATTSWDTVSFFITAPAEHAERLLELLKEIVFNPAFEKQEFLDEKNVILKEILLNRDRPDRQLYELLYATAYLVHPYRHPIIGYPDIFRTLTREDLIAYYNKTFVPNNAVIALVGDIPSDEAFILAKKLFSDLGRPVYKADIRPREPNQITPRSATQEADVQLARMAMSFPSTELLHPDLFATDLLAAVLGRGDGSRLNTKLEKRLQLVRSISAVNDTPKDPGLFTITATLEPKNIAQVKKIILQELEELKQTPPSEEELERAKNMLTSERIYSYESTQELATTLSTDELLTGDAEFYKHYIEKIKTITAADISAMARAYFSADRLTVVTLLPRGYQETQQTETPPAVIPSIQTSKKQELTNGIRLIAIENSTIPSLSITVSFLGGVRAESPQNNGISQLTTQLLLKGTATKDESQIASAFEQRGGSIDTFSEANSFGLTVRVLKEDADFALDMLEDILQNPSFPQEELDKLKKRIIAAIKLKRENIFAQGSDELNRLLYADHPYALNPLGTEESIGPIAREDVIGFYATHAISATMTVAACGDFDSSLLLQKLAQRFTGFKKTTNPALVASKPIRELPEDKTATLTMPKAQALVMCGLLGTTIRDPDRFPLEVLSSIMSGASGRLFLTIRNMQSLSYTQNFFNRIGYDRGMFGIYVATSPENISAATAAALKQLKGLNNKGVNEEEIKNAKTELIADYRVALQQNSFVSMQAALFELYGLGFETIFDYEKAVNNVTKEQVDACIARYIGKARYALVTITPPRQEK